MSKRIALGGAVHAARQGLGSSSRGREWAGDGGPHMGGEQGKSRGISRCSGTSITFLLVWALACYAPPIPSAPAFRRPVLGAGIRPGTAQRRPNEVKPVEAKVSFWAAAGADRRAPVALPLPHTLTPHVSHTKAPMRRGRPVHSANIVPAAVRMPYKGIFLWPRIVRS